MMAKKVSWSALWKPSHRPKRSDSETFSSTASDGLIAVERRLERLVGRILAVEREIVAEHHEAPVGLADAGEQGGQRGDVLAVDLDQRQRTGRAAHLAVHMGMDRLYDRALARAARAPQ